MTTTSQIHSSSPQKRVIIRSSIKLVVVDSPKYEIFRIKITCNAPGKLPAFHKKEQRRSDDAHLLFHATHRPVKFLYFNG